MDTNFSKFENFGYVGDKTSRKALAKAIFDEVQRTTMGKIALYGAEINVFGAVVDEILSNKTMRELCESDAGLAEKITQDVLEFLSNAKKEGNKNASFVAEHEALTQFSQLTKTEFDKAFSEDKSNLRSFLGNLKALYPEIDLAFYEREWTLSLGGKEENTQSFESIKEHLLDKWALLLLKKETAFHLNIIDGQRQQFCAALYERVEELKMLKIGLAPFTQELGRFWDMSKGNWQQINFDLIQHYAALLKNDKALVDLADMLGKMQQAETAFETQSYENGTIKTEWKTTHAQKSDLVGVHESDDLSSLLPSETAFLGDSILQTVFFKKFAEKKLQTFQYQNKTFTRSPNEEGKRKIPAHKDGKGPFIICIDTSGSMQGTPETVAKMLCFALLKIAVKDNRKCYLISFSTEIKTLNLTDFEHSLEALLQFLAMSFLGGTDATPSVSEALKQLESTDYNKADILMISDFVMPQFDTATKERIQKAKEKNTKFHSLVIGSSHNKNIVKDFDNNWIYDPNNRNSMLTFVRDLNKIK